MENKILNYIKTLSNNKEEQELLIETIGYILSKQINIKLFIGENNDKIIHIRDWIASIIENKEQWKIPRVLTLDALNNAADKYFEKKNNRLETIELDENHEKLLADLGDYYTVQMLTAEALDEESKVMQHCIGHGGYDNNLNKEDYQYLSLRDKYNKAHVTLEVYKKEILQLQGKQNKIPEDKYLKILIPWLMEDNYKNIPWIRLGKYYDNGKIINIKDLKAEENIDFILEIKNNKYKVIKILDEKGLIYFEKNVQFAKESLYFFVDKDNILYNIIDTRINKIDMLEILQELKDNDYKSIPFEDYGYVLNKNDNKIYSIYNLPENCEIDCDLTVEDFEKIPDNLTINGSLNFGNEVFDAMYEKQKKITLPKNLTVKNLFLSSLNIEELPNDIKIKNSLYAIDTKLNKLPDNMTLNVLNLFRSLCVETLPKNLTVNMDLNLKETNVKIMPDDIKINGNLNLNGTKIKKLPDNFEVKGDFEFQNSIIKELPENIKIGGSLLLKKSQIKKLPDNLNINGDLNLDYSEIEHIPNNLNVNRNLYLTNTNVKSLPDNIKVKNSIYLPYSKIKKIPDNLVIEGELDISNCLDIIELPNNLNVKKLDMRWTKIEKIGKDIFVSDEIDIAYSKIKYIHEDFRCKIIDIDESQICLLDENMDVEEIGLYGEKNGYSYSYKKNEFFEKYKNKFGNTAIKC